MTISNPTSFHGRFCHQMSTKKKKKKKKLCFLRFFDLGKLIWCCGPELPSPVHPTRDVPCQSSDTILTPPVATFHSQSWQRSSKPRLQLALKAFCPIPHPAVQPCLPLPEAVTPSLQAHSRGPRPYSSAPTHARLAYSPGVSV